jgi:hypothetical protein
MSSSVAPLFPKTSVFIPAYWENARSEILTQDEADARYLKFPVGQGTESIPNLIVSGQTTLGITSASTLTLSNSMNIGSATTATGNMNFDTDKIERKTTTAGTNQSIQLNCINTTLSGDSQVQLRSGNNTTDPSVLITAESSNLIYSELEVAGSDFNLYNQGEEGYSAGFTSFRLTGDTIITPASVMYVKNTTSDTYPVGIKCKYNDATAQGIIEFFTGATIDVGANIASFSNTAISLYSSGATTASFTSSVITFFENLTFNSNTGYLEKSNVEATTSGNFTMTSANSFQTTINTPTANRNFILPAPAGQLTGTTYGICNKSTSFTIAVQSPAGTTIFTIPVATNATNGGSFAKFAINLSGSVNTYFRCG